MSTRTWLAGLAMQGMAASENWGQNFDQNSAYLKEVAEIAVKAADALLLELSKP